LATGIRRWIGRRRGQTALVPTVRAPKREPDGEATYVGTTVGGSQQHRIVGGALFGRGECRYWIEPGQVVFQRDGAGGGLTVALTGISQVGLAGAHAGRVLAPSRIAIVTWRLGGDDADTGFGFSDSKHAELFADRIAAAAGLSPDKGPHAGA
jgi:hypothetical protein